MHRGGGAQALPERLAEQDSVGRLDAPVVARDDSADLEAVPDVEPDGALVGGLHVQVGGQDVGVRARLRQGALQQPRAWHHQHAPQRCRPPC